MSSQTPNLNLVLPVGTEKVSRQIINDNNTKIDTAVGANSEAIAKLDSNVNSTNDILASAVSCTKTTFFNGSGGSYTGSVPASNYKWATFMVNVKGAIKNVIAHAPQGMIAINSYDSGAWTGWQEFVRKNDTGYYTLLNGENVTSTLTEITLYDGRKLSNYNRLIAIVKRGSYYRTSMEMPQMMLGNNSHISLNEVDSVNTQRWYEIKYVSDTKVTIQASTNAGDALVYLYGIN